MYGYESCFEEGWAMKNWCFWTVVLEKTLESPLDCKKIEPVHSEGDQPWDFFGRNDAKAETPVLWPPDAKSWLIGKDSDAGRDCGQEKKGTTEDEMAGWHHWLDGCESEWTGGVGDGQGGLACCDSWGHKESDTTEQLNWTEHVHTCARSLELVGLFGSSLFQEVAEQFLASPSSLWDRESCWRWEHQPSAAPQPKAHSEPNVLQRCFPK